MKKHLLSSIVPALLIVLALFALTGCKDRLPENQDIPVTGISVSPETLLLAVGESSTLSATVLPADASNKALTWISGDERIATVSDGKVTGLSAGETTVTARSEDGGKTASCKVTVVEKAVPVSSVSLNTSSLSLFVGESATLTATVLPDDATNPAVSWSSSQESVATVTGGTVRALAPGETLVTVTTADGGLAASCTVTVSRKPVRVSSLQLDKTHVDLLIGETETLSLTVLPEDADDKSVTWTSLNSAVAAVKEGVISAIGPGETRIRVTAQDGSGVQTECTVTVKKKPEYTAVDLGLSVKWANMNVDAYAPEEAGSYFAWGETAPKSSYGWENYRFSLGADENGPFSKYNAEDGKKTLDPEDDAATVRMGEGWRMPTVSERYELLFRCNWTWTMVGDVAGYLVSGKTEGYTDQSIFLPAAGGWYGTSLKDAGTFGCYWMAALDSWSYAYSIYFYSISTGRGTDGRCYGFPVRAVCE